MELTEKERAQLTEIVEAMELRTLKILALLVTLEMGKDITANAVATGKDIAGDNLGSLAEIRAILEIPLEDRDQRGKQ